MIKWNDVAESLPDSEIEVLVFFDGPGAKADDGDIEIGAHDGERWHCRQGFTFEGITHWAEMPQIPGETPDSVELELARYESLLDHNQFLQNQAARRMRSNSGLRGVITKMRNERDRLQRELRDARKELKRLRRPNK